MTVMSTTAEWDALGADERRYNAKRMAVYAGMVEAMDFHIGRLVAHLRASGELERTIFLFTSDNGAEPSGPMDPRSFANRAALWLQDYDSRYDRLGQKGSFNTIGASFASAAVTPLAYYKFYAGEGGMRVPLIVSGARLAPVRRLSPSLSFVTDIAPTLLDLAGVGHPGTRYGDRGVEPMIGRSLMPIIDGRSERIYGERDPIGFELGGNSALFLGDHKLVRNRAPRG